MAGRTDAPGQAVATSEPSRSRVRFPEGLIGLPELIDFALIDHELSQPLRLLQSLTSPRFVFVLINAFSICPDYALELPDEDAAALQVCSAADVLVLAVVSLPEGEAATANLLSPLVINVRSGLGKQVLLAGSGYPIHYRFLKGDNASEAPA